MRKNKNMYEFTYYNANSLNSENEYNHNSGKNKSLIISIIIIAIFISLIVAYFLFLGKDKTLTTVSSVITQEVDEQNQLEQKQKVEAEKKEQERLEQERLKKEEEERKAREAKLPKLTEEGIQNLENIYHSDEKRVFLTFDDGPSPVTNQILDTLKENNIKATFFVLGTSVKAFPETTKKIYDEGHFIANHGYSHVYSSIYSSKEAVLDEYNRCNDAVKEVIGEPEYNSHLFRFPGGLPGGKYANLKQEAKQLLNENGILNIDWNALSGDAEKQNPTPEYLMERIQVTSEGKNSIVVLMHDASAKKATADLLPEIIKFYKDQGYEFKTFYDIIK